MLALGRGHTPPWAVTICYKDVGRVYVLMGLREVFGVPTVGKGEVSLQRAADFVLCRLVSWIHPHTEPDRQGGQQRHIEAGSLLLWQTKPGGTF